NVQHAAVDEDVPVPHELTCLLARGRKTHAVDQIIQPALERVQQRLARDARLLQHALEDVAELALREPIDPLHLLFLAQLLGVLRRFTTAAGRLAMLTGRVRTPLDRALLRQAARALEKQLGAFAAAQPANRTRVACHPLHPPLLGRTAPIVRNRRHVTDRTDLQARAGERLNRGLAAGTRTLDTHMHTL